MTNEEFYDKELAPALLTMAKKCEERGMSLCATVEYEHGEVGLTVQVAEGAGIQMLMAYWGAAARGNADSLIIALIKHAREHGHNSIYLARFIDTQPQGGRAE